MSTKLSGGGKALTGDYRLWNMYNVFVKSFLSQIHQMFTFPSPAYTLMALQPRLICGPRICSLSSFEQRKETWFGMTMTR